MVADEVRNLATKSAANVRDSEILIAKTLIAVENGTKITQETANSLEKIVEGVNYTIDSVSEIVEVMDKQVAEVDKITYTVNEISGVIQNTSALSEESAATSEELSAQAQLLKDLVFQFKID